MNKEDFFEALDKAKEHFSKWDYAPKGLRLDHRNDPFDPHWNIWIVGPGSIDPTLVLASDIWPVKGKYKVSSRAEKAFEKYTRWFDEWEEFEEWKSENSFE